jgi:undecaprenyl-diphosphatase
MFETIQAADSKLFLSVFSKYSNSTLSKSALLISWSADGWLYFLLVPIIFLFKLQQGNEILLLAIQGFAGERMIYLMLKSSFKRRRPPKYLDSVESLITASDEFILPSGHTSAAFFFVTFLCVGISPLFILMYLWAIAVGLSRVILGVHFPSDILAGAAVGSMLALTVI